MIQSKCLTCGKEFSVFPYQIKKGRGKYCSVVCVPKDNGDRVKKHGAYKTRLYRIWSQMKGRCYSKSANGYYQYGAVGICVCEEWKRSFESFQSWAIKSGYDKSLTIDRVDCAGNYESGNCRWATRKQQKANTRKPKTGITSRFKGVCKPKGSKDWVAQCGRKNAYIGKFSNEVDAAKAYDAAARKLYGEFANVNFK